MDVSLVVWLRAVGLAMSRMVWLRAVGVVVSRMVWLSLCWCGCESCGVSGAETIDMMASIMQCNDELTSAVLIRVAMSRVIMRRVVSNE